MEGRGGRGPVAGGRGYCSLMPLQESPCSPTSPLSLLGCPFGTFPNPTPRGLALFLWSICTLTETPEDQRGFIQDLSFWAPVAHTCNPSYLGG
jgi:hypothetical protein